MADTGRAADVALLHNQLKGEKSSERRDSIKRTISRINNESPQVKSMRESLVKAHRDGNQENIKDIHDYIKGKKGYGQDERI